MMVKARNGEELRGQQKKGKFCACVLMFLSLKRKLLKGANDDDDDGEKIGLMEKQIEGK